MLLGLAAYENTAPNYGLSEEHRPLKVEKSNSHNGNVVASEQMFEY